MDARPARETSLGAAALAELGDLIAGEESLLAPHLLPSGADSPLGALAAAGERAAADPAGYAFVIEAVREGYLLHYGRPRIFAGVDPDLALLAGDYLYALGLGRLAAIGDPLAVAELADLISISAMLEAEVAGRPAIDAFWIASALAMGSGGSDSHAEAKRAIRSAASGDGVRALAEGAARRFAEDLALRLPLAEVAEAIHFDEQSDEGGVHA
ncbi:hypothetical protein HJD18_16950 [Thermoleophilia bacterium SCSIO 60948]|nr:hypothetical protein HJD18_16950 [Thermoleophilia bacterium SCSIO 60948]